MELPKRGWLLALVALWTGLELWQVQAHWINVDEGAHLMDAWLITLGLVPDVDFLSRQPLYSLLYTPMVGMGGGYHVARLVPMVATLLSAFLIRLIGNKFGKGVGDLAALLYLFAPPVIAHSPLIKTEPPVIVTACLAIWAYLKFRESARAQWLVLAGISCGLGFYIRESALATFFALLLLLLFDARSGRGAATLILSWGGVVLTALLVYSRWLPWGEMLRSRKLFPPSALLNALDRMVGAASPSGTPMRASDQTFRRTLISLYEPIFLDLALLGAALLCVFLWRRCNAEEKSGVRTSTCWLALIALLYTHQILKHGFYQAYILEFLPPLALLAAIGLNRQYGPRIVLRVAALLPVLLVVGLLSQDVRFFRPLYAFLILGGLAIVGGAVSRLVGRRFLSGFLVACSLGSAVYAGARIDLRYTGEVNPAVVKEISALLRQKTGPDQEVLSSAVIWEFEARRRPFSNWSHPLSLNSAAAKPELWRSLFASNPPDAIVWDTKARILFSRFPEVAAALENDYRLDAEIDGVKLYLRKPHR